MKPMYRYTLSEVMEMERVAREHVPTLVCIQCGADESVESEFRASLDGTVYCDICAEQIQKAIGYSGKEGYKIK